MEKAYGRDFYIQRDAKTRASAQAVNSVLLEMLRPSSVVDIGCGVGTWLAVFREMGVQDVLGIEGGTIDADLMQIPADRVIVADLEKPLQVARRFDLAITLEVAEHLRPEAAETFVESVTRLAPAVLFSAAIPGQGGTLHFNEQWPEYWIERFHQAGYCALDCIRPRMWQSESVLPWYAQNSFLFVEARRLAESPALLREVRAGEGWPLHLIHPGIFARRVGLLQKFQKLYGDPKRRSLPKLVAKVQRFLRRMTSSPGG